MPGGHDHRTTRCTFIRRSHLQSCIRFAKQSVWQLDWQGGGLDIKGVLHPATDSARATVELVGTGRTGTGTEGWEYDYYGHLAHVWPIGLNQVPVILGSVLRAKPHNGAPAGYVASFFAVKQ